MESTTPLSCFSLRKGRGGCAGMEIQSANKLWAMQNLCSKCNFLWHAGGKMMLWWCQGLYAYKNTVLELNTKFCFMNTLIRNNWFRLRAFLLFFFILPVNYWLFHCVWKQDGWIFSKSIVISYSSVILYLSRRNFSHFSWRKPVQAACRACMQAKKLFILCLSSIFPWIVSWDWDVMSLDWNLSRN